MRILADVNVPEEYVSALRGDGHEVSYSRDVDALGPTATDADITEHAEREGTAILSTDAKDFGSRDTPSPCSSLRRTCPAVTFGQRSLASKHYRSIPQEPSRFG